MTDKELLQEVLESIKWLRVHLERDHACLHMKPTVSGIPDWLNKTEASLRARLSQPEPEPFEYWNAVEGWVKIDEVRQHFDTTNCGTIYKHEGEGRIPLYAEPPQHEWVGLTDAELESIYDACDNWGKFEYERRLEAKLKEKNT